MWDMKKWKPFGSSTCKEAQQFLELLTDVFGKDAEVPSDSLRQAMPFLIGRYVGYSSQSQSVHEQTREHYVFQLGPRAWTEVIYTHLAPKYRDDDHLPAYVDHLPVYVRDAKKVAQTLKLTKWDELAKVVSTQILKQIILQLREDGEEMPAILNQVVEQSPKFENREIGVYLCWQGNQRFCVIRDQTVEKAFCLTWTNNSLTLLGEAHPERLNALPGRHQTWERPIISLEEGTYRRKIVECAEKMDDLRAEISWRYDTKLDHLLDPLLFEAFGRLQEIEGDLGLAFSRHRFNDAGGDESWLAVRVGNFAWENGAYFTRNKVSLRSAPPEIHLVLGVLTHLVECNVADAFDYQYGNPVDPMDVIGLFRESGGHYFACCDSNGSAGPVYEVDMTTATVRLVGFTDRFDWNFNNGSHAGGIIPKTPILGTVSIDEVIRRVETGDIPDDGPPDDLKVGWRFYLPQKPGQ